MLPLVYLLRRRMQAHHTEAAAQSAARRQAELPFSPATLQVLLCIAGIACCVAMSMPQVHLVAYCGDLGYGAARGAEMLSLMLGFGIVSRIASGFIADRIGGVRTLLLGSVLQGTALFLYLFFDGLTSLYVISALFGLFQGGIVPSYAIIVREYFSPREAGTRIGLVLMATLLGMALGGWMSGAIFDFTGSYQAAFLNGLGWNLLNVSIATWLLLRVARSPTPPALRLERLVGQFHHAGRARLDAGEVRRRFRQHALHEEARGDELGAHALRRRRSPSALGERGFRDPAPHVAERHQPEHVHVVGRAGAGIVGLGHGVLHEPHAWPAADGRARRRAASRRASSPRRRSSP